jgi:transposase-like protein
VILLAVGWYLRFSLSYRDVEELLAERGLRVDHVTVWRWVQRYAAYPPAIVQLKAEGVLEENCGHRPVQYLNNVLEQDQL